MKKLNKLVAILVAMAMVLSLTVISAFAANSDGDKDAVIGKYLKVNSGTNVPNDYTVTFNFTAQDSTTQTAAATPAPVNTASLTTAGGENATLKATANTSDANAVAGVVAIADLFKYATAENGHEIGDLVFTKPGVYTYKVTESAPTGSTTSQDGKVTTTYTDDSTYFMINIYVNYKDGELAIDTITLADEAGNKLDPIENPQTDPNFVPDSATDDGATFVNNLEKKKAADPEPEDPDKPNIDPDDPTKNVLNVTKAVAGATSYIPADQVFPFQIKIAKPANATDTANTKAIGFIMEKDGETWKHVGENGTKVEITYGAADWTEFNLKANQALVFNELPLGATYLVNEDLDKTAGNPAAEVVVNHANYTPAYNWIDVTEAVPGGGQAANKGKDLAITEGLIAENDTQNKVDYTNTLSQEDTTPTGILISNLPYIALALVAIGGLVAYVVVRRRQDDEA